MISDKWESFRIPTRIPNIHCSLLETIPSDYFSNWHGTKIRKSTIKNRYKNWFTFVNKSIFWKNDSRSACPSYIYTIFLEKDKSMCLLFDPCDFVSKTSIGDKIGQRKIDRRNRSNDLRRAIKVGQQLRFLFHSCNVNITWVKGLKNIDVIQK